ncbi:MAG: cyclic nucleotide-binding domain-containing protein [Deltaproteobacteria bacterium]|nr:cyclic nucleotide-binding domain-containing protein [Deltaproteobacteria bacterium]
MERKIQYNIANEETYQDGQIIFKEGSPGDWVYVILSGSVEISKDIRGQKDIIEKLQPGDVFGELE